MLILLVFHYFIMVKIKEIQTAKMHKYSIYEHMYLHENFSMVKIMDKQLGKFYYE